MAINPFLTSINSGEFSPRMEARVDFERYPNAAKLARNFVLYPQGGMTRRPGTRFVKEVKSSSALTKLIPFEFSEVDSYMIEAGNLYMRFYRHQGSIVVESTDAAITNGNFAADITGWTDKSTNGAAIAHDSTNDRLQLTGANGGIAWAEQGVTISAGNTAKEHVLRFKIEGFAGEVGFQVGTTTGASDILDEVELAPGYHSIAFTPGATTFYVQFRNNVVPVRDMFVDDIAFLSDQAFEVISPYTTAQLEEIQYFQAADLVYITHPDLAIRKIERRGHLSWSIVEATFEDGPYGEINDGNDINDFQLFTNALFDNGITGWTDVSSGDGFTAYNEAGKFAELDPGSSGGSGNAILRSSATTVASQKHVVHVLIVAAGPVDVKIGSVAGGTQYISTTQQPGWMSYEFNSSSSSGGTLHVEFSYNEHDQGRAGIGGCLAYNENARLIEPSATTGEVTLTAYGHSPFKSSDVGRLIRLEWPGQEPGYGIVTAYTSATSVSMLVLRELASTAPTESWRLGAWGGENGYPKVIAFFDGRLAAANTNGQPNTLWLSQSGKLENMRPDSYEDGASTVEDDDAISATLRSTKINPIFWMAGQRQLMVGTAGGQWVIQSSQAVVTPDDISAKQHASVSCAPMRNIEINQIILFADRARHEVHDLGFSLEDDSFLATDLTILSDHIFRSRIEEMVYQRNPYSIVWARRADGRIASLSYNKQHQVLGWSQSIIGGSFGDGDAVVESIATIPGSDNEDQQYNSDERNELWMIVKRTIDGETKRYIEFMEYFFDGPLREDYDTEKEWRDAVRESQADAFYVDCGLTYDGTPTTTVTGLDHLEGQVVKVLADGKIQPEKTVSGGAISFNDAATKVHVGLAYKHRYEGLKLAVDGTAINKVKIITNVGLILLDAAQFKISTVDYDEDGRRVHDLYTVDFIRDYMSEDDAVPLFTGEQQPSTEGVYSTDSRIYIEGDAPLPFTLLGLAPQMEIRNA